MKIVRLLILCLALLSCNKINPVVNPTPQPAMCVDVVQEAASVTSNPDHYMPAPVSGDRAKNEPDLMWATIDHLDKDGNPVYKSLTIFATLRVLNYSVDPQADDANDYKAAILAISKAWQDQSGGDPMKPISYEDSRTLFKNAENNCPAAYVMLTTKSG